MLGLKRRKTERTEKRREEKRREEEPQMNIISQIGEKGRGTKAQRKNIICRGRTCTCPGKFERKLTS